MAQQLVASAELAKAKKALMKVTKGDDLRKDALIMHARDIRWEEFLEPAPLSVALLGQLLLIAGKKDFTLAQNPPTNGFKLLKYPNSFRASLVQVSNEGWGAFNEAHTNMDQIRLHTQNIPGHLKAAVKIILSGTNHDIAYMLEEPLISIQFVADECLELALSTERKFVGVVELIGELIEACTNAGGQYEEDIKKKTIAIEIAKECKQQAEAQTELAKKHLETLQRDVDREHEAYRESISAGAGFVHGVNKLIGGMAKAATKILHPMNTMIENIKDHRRIKKDEQSEEGSSRGRDIYLHAEDIMKIVQSLSELTKVAHDREYIDRVIRVIVKTERIRDKIRKKPLSEEKELAMGICDKTLEVAKKIKNEGQSIVGDQSKLYEEVQKDINDLKTESVKFHAKACAEGGVQMGATPRMSKNPDADPGDLDEYNFKLNMQCEMLKHQQKRYDAAYDKFTESSQKITDAMMEISKCNIEIIDFNEIRDVLLKGIKALAEVREEWGKMVRFFQCISNMIKCTLNTSLKSFSGMVKKGQMMNQDGVGLSDCVVDQIYTNTFEAAKIAHVVNNVAGMYVDVSDRYLMDRVASLGQLVALDPEKEGHLMQLKFQQLTDDCKVTQRHIRHLVHDKQREFHQAVAGRIEQLETELRPALSAVPAATDARNKMAAQAAIAEMDEDMDQFT